MNITLKFNYKLNPSGLKKAVHRMNIKNIGHSAALIRKIAARSIRYRVSKTNASPAGSPPFTHRSSVSPYRIAPLRKSIQYKVEKDTESAVIGVGFTGLLDIGYAHEKGGWYKTSRITGSSRLNHYPKRPFMKPALIKAVPSIPKIWYNSLKK